jgi:hypothetical protein
MEELIMTGWGWIFAKGFFHFNMVVQCFFSLLMSRST